MGSSTAITLLVPFLIFPVFPGLVCARSLSLFPSWFSGSSQVIMALFIFSSFWRISCILDVFTETDIVILICGVEILLVNILFLTVFLMVYDVEVAESMVGGYIPVCWFRTSWTPSFMPVACGFLCIPGRYVV